MVAVQLELFHNLYYSSHVYKISIMFTSRSVGTLVGSMMGGAVKKVANERFNHLLSLGEQFPL